MIDQKNFSGILNTDDSVEVMPATHHKFALNGRFRGNGVNTRFENVEGTTLIPNGYLPEGSNECIGSFYDSLNQRIIWFNWNSEDKHGIYLYNKITNAVTPLFINYTNTSTDVLQFDLDDPIASVDIVYGSDDIGDFLCWIQRLVKPRILNIKDAIDNIYGSDWLSEYIDVAKEPPSIPIKCAYENDNTVTVNNLKRLSFIAKYRYVYKNNLKSVWSAWSNQPIPYNYTDTTTNADATKNCKIGMVVQTGGEDVVEIEVAVAQQEGNGWSDFFSVAVLNKADLSISDDDTYVWRFFNNESYVPVDVKESGLKYDWIPNNANSQTLLNGNVICYGGCTEGYNTVVPIASVTASTQLPTAVNDVSILSVTQGGKSGFSTGNVRFIVLGTIRKGDVFSAQILVGATTYTITYTAIYGDTPATVLAGLSTSATGQGFTEVSISANELVISRTGQILQKSNLAPAQQVITGLGIVVNASNNTITVAGAYALYSSLFIKGTLFYITASVSANTNLLNTVSVANSAGDLVITVTKAYTNETIVSSDITLIPSVNVSVPSYSPASKESLGIVYFDEKGKTNGVITKLGIDITSAFYDIPINLNTLLYKIPYFNLSISHRPPDWAKYYHIVRSNNLTKQNYLYWMSDRTYKDDKFAYISIESIQSYKKLNPTSIVSYSFSAGDRIRFCVLFNADSTPATTYGSERDYEIYEQVINPNINGVVRNGQFLKIVLPSTSGTFDFSNGVTKTFSFYFIELYTPAKSATPELSVYFEFSQRYMIGDAGLATRFHQGQLQNQTTDLVTPATFKLDTGDAYYRTREINVGDVLSYSLVAGGIEPNFILGQNLTSQLFPNPDYTIAESVAYQQLIGTGGNYNNPGWTFNNLTTAYTFLCKGIINVTANTATSGTIYFYARVADSSGVATDYTLGSKATATLGENFTLNPNVNVIMTANSKVFIYMSCTDSNFRGTLVYGNLNFSEPTKSFLVGCIDKNFSDFYDSEFNPNGRPETVHKNETETSFGTLVRWGLSYILNTNINQLNRFYPQNFDECDRSFGDIQRLAILNRQMIVFQERQVGRYGVYAKYIQSNDGNALTTTDEIITKNNINYIGNYGLGNQYCGLIKGRDVFYFKDPVRGYEVRLSQKGLDPISEQNKGRFFIQPKFIPYNKPFLRTNGSKAKILGAYNFEEEEAITVLQGGVYSGETIESYTFSFNEPRNGYCSFFEFNPEWIDSIEKSIVTWKNGQLYIHNNVTDYTKFYEVKKYPSIMLVFNDKIGIKKTFNSLAYQANQLWTASQLGDVYTNQKNEQTGLIQQSSIKEWNIEKNEGRYYAYFNRDANSNIDRRVGLIEGDYLKGGCIIVNLSYIGNEFAFLYLPYVDYDESARNY